MKKIIYWALILIALMLAYGAYQSYFVQRKAYQDNVVMHLENTCAQIIQNYFGQHASDFDVKRDGDRFGIESGFTIYNDLTFLSVYGRSDLFFEGFAPQKVICIAYMVSGRQEKITENTKVKISIITPLHLPNKYNELLPQDLSFTLTMKQIENNLPILKRFPLEKPKYNIFNFYMD